MNEISKEHQVREILKLDILERLEIRKLPLGEVDDPVHEERARRTEQLDEQVITDNERLDVIHFNGQYPA